MKCGCVEGCGVFSLDVRGSALVWGPVVPADSCLILLFAMDVHEKYLTL
jgi:hypothetical protein